jgi:hypothetical protein
MAAQAQASNSQVSLTHCMAGSNTCVGHKRGQSRGGNKQKQTADIRQQTPSLLQSILLWCVLVWCKAQQGELIALKFVSHVGFYAPSGIGKIQKYSTCTMHKKGDFSSGTCMYAGQHVFFIL